GAAFDRYYTGLRGERDLAASRAHAHRATRGVRHLPRLAAGSGDLDRLGTRGVVDRDRRPFLRLDHAPAVLAIGVGHRRVCTPVPQRPEHERTVKLAVLEGDRHLIADVREEVEAVVRPGGWRHIPGPR